jgi:hypothetical protein
MQIGEQEYNKANQRMNMVICLPKLEIITRDPYVSVDVAWVTHQESTPSRVPFNHFPYFTISFFFSYGGEADLHKLYHNSPQPWEL